MKHLLTLADWSADEITAAVSLAIELKRKAADGLREPLLAGKFLVQVFDKPSLRTRTSFDAAMARHGGSASFMTSKEAGWVGGREKLEDVATVLGSMADAIVIRTFSQQLVADVAAAAGVPVINALTDDSHPMQALADVMTMREATGKVTGAKLVFVGDGNNVAKSLAIAAGKLGFSFTLCAPEGYAFSDATTADLKAAGVDSAVTVTADPDAAVTGADFVYTDVWTSMGQEAEKQKRLADFAGYQVDEKLMASAPERCKFLHCLPAHRGEEVTAGVIDGPQSLVFIEAENRMHTAAAVLATLIA
ncbi:MAG: ornithine carbamoyltransferase [Planctomycetota bacterium]